MSHVMLRQRLFLRGRSTTMRFCAGPAARLTRTSPSRAKAPHAQKPLTRKSPSRAHKPIRQRPRQDEATRAVHDATRPKSRRAVEEGGRADLAGCRPDTQRPQQRRRQQREDEVEEEAGVGLEAEDASADAAERGRLAVQVRQDLVWSSAGPRARKIRTRVLWLTES
jgi:hypothetical protein